MIRQMKLSIKLMRYAFGIKMCTICVLVFFVLGILVSLVSAKAGTMSTAGLLLLLSGVWLTQLLLSLGSARFVQASPWNKPIQTTMATLVGFLGFAAAYVVSALLKLLYLPAASGEMLQNMSAELVLDALAAMLTMIYCGAAYKYYITSTVMFLLAYIGLSVVYPIFLYPVTAQLPLVAAAGIGGLMLVVGAALQYGISLLVYKTPISKRAMFRGLQKYMQ